MVTLLTDRLVLRPVGREDAAGLHRISTLPEVREQLLPGQELRESSDHVAALSEVYPDRFLAFMILLRAGGPEPVGSCGLSILSPIRKLASVGWEIHPDQWGRGYATEAAVALLSLGFGPCRLERIRGECFHDNVGSRRVMEKAGLHEQESVAVRVALWARYRGLPRPAVRYEIRREPWLVDRIGRLEASDDG